MDSAVDEVAVSEDEMELKEIGTIEQVSQQRGQRKQSSRQARRQSGSPRKRGEAQHQSTQYARRDPVRHGQWHDYEDAKHDHKQHHPEDAYHGHHYHHKPSYDHQGYRKYAQPNVDDHAGAARYHYSE